MEPYLDLCSSFTKNEISDLLSLLSKIETETLFCKYLSKKIRDLNVDKGLGSTCVIYRETNLIYGKLVIFVIVVVDRVQFLITINGFEALKVMYFDVHNFSFYRGIPTMKIFSMTTQTSIDIIKDHFLLD